MNFVLSSGTLKELGRGSIMRIAMPVQWEGSTEEVVRDAFGMLPIPYWVEVVECHRQLVATSPAADATGIMKHLGYLCENEPPSPSKLYLYVDVVIITLRDSRRKSWGSVYPLRWPAAVEFHDQVIE
jgi:hypothetical protein